MTLHIGRTIPFEGFWKVGELYDPSYRWNKFLLRRFEGVESSRRCNKLLLRGFEGLESSTTFHIGGTNSLSGVRPFI